MKIFLLFSTLIFILTSCNIYDRYTLEKVSQNEVYLLDKKTGVITPIINGEVQKTIISPQEYKKQKELLGSAAIIKNLPDISITKFDNLELNLKTSWRDSNLFYILSVSKTTPKFEKLLQTPNNFIEVNLLDENGFSIVKFNILLKNLKETIDLKTNKTIFQTQDKIYCSADTYKDISNWEASFSSK